MPAAATHHMSPGGPEPKGNGSARGTKTRFSVDGFLESACKDLPSSNKPSAKLWRGRPEAIYAAGDWRRRLARALGFCEKLKKGFNESA